MRSLFNSQAEDIERFLLDAVQEAAIVTRVDGTIILWNPAAERLYGWPAAEVLGHDIRDVTVPQARIADAESIMSRLSEGRTWSGEFEVRRRDGSTLLAEVRNSPVRDDAGNLVGVLGLSRNLTEERRRQQRAVETEAQLRTLLDESDRVRGELLRREAALRFLSETSHALSRSLEVSESVDLIAHLALDWYADWCAIHIRAEDGSLRRVVVSHRDSQLESLASELQERGADLEPVRRVIDTGQPLFVPLITSVGLRRRGIANDRADLVERLGISSAVIVPLVGRQGNLGTVSFVRSDPERTFDEDDLLTAEEFGRRAGLELENARLFEELQRANRIKDEFLGLVSHELRTPLTTIIGLSSLLSRRMTDLDEDSRQEAADELHLGANRLRSLIENLLILARLQHEDFEPEPFLVQRLPPQVVSHFATRSPERPVLTEIPDDLPPVLGQPTWFMQVLENLLGNAHKYSPAGGRVIVEAAAAGADVLVRVSDEGPGISTSERERIFDPFFRSPSTAHLPGAGVGLAVCRRLLEVMGGSIACVTPEGSGASFEVRLPLAPE